MDFPLIFPHHPSDMYQTKVDSPKGRLHPSPEGSRKRCSGKPSRKLGFESCSWMNFKLVEENLRCPACTLNRNCHLNEPRAWSPLLSVFWGWNPRSGQDHASAVLASRALGLPLWGVSILSWAGVRLGNHRNGEIKMLSHEYTYLPTYCCFEAMEKIFRVGWLLSLHSCLWYWGRRSPLCSQVVWVLCMYPQVSLTQRNFFEGEL